MYRIANISIQPIYRDKIQSPICNTGVYLTHVLEYWSNTCVADTCLIHKSTITGVAQLALYNDHFHRQTLLLNSSTFETLKLYIQHFDLDKVLRTLT